MKPDYYEFGGFRLDPVKRLLTRDGVPLPLTQKAFDTLLVLVQNSERVVDKDELMKAVWPDTAVEENNLTQSISTLRKGLGESRKDHKYIVTIQGRGYRFVGAVTNNLHPPRFGSRISRTQVIAALVLLTVICGVYLWRVQSARAPESSITVARSHNQEAHQAYVKGRYFWKKRTEAELLRAIEYFRQAIAADSNYAPAYAGLADSYLMIAAYGYGSLPPEEAAEIARTAAVKALELDESLAEAHTSLAAFFEGFKRDLSAAEQEYKRAIELDPNYATARQWYGEFLRSAERFDEALVELKRAQELDPLSPVMNASLGMSYYFARQYDLVIEQNRKALEIDPDFASAHLGLGLAFEQQGMYEDAIAEFKRARDLSMGGEPMIAALGHAYAKSGARDKALGEFRELQQRRKPASPYNLALFYVAFGEKDKALPLLQKAREEAGDHLMLKLDPRLDSLRSDSRFEKVFKS